LKKLICQSIYRIAQTKLKIQISMPMNITPIKCKNNDMYMQYLLYENKQMCSNIYKRILN